MRVCQSTVADAVPGRAAANVPVRVRSANSWRALRRGIALGLAAVLVPAALGACGSAPGKAPGTASVVSAPVRIAHTSLGTVGYRIVGTGPPLVLIMGYGWTMEDWDPRLVHALAAHHRVVMFDNAGVGDTAALPPPFSIDAMADQTSALIDALGLGRADVLGWSMGGMIAQALAVMHPAQVRRLVLCATYPGTGAAVVPTAAVRQASSDFPANQSAASAAFKAAVAEYPAAPVAPQDAKVDQGSAVADWRVGIDTAGHEISRISAPTLVADGTDDQLVPAVNDHLLARLIPGARLVLYPDAGHAFLFQDITSFASLVDSFLAGPPGS
jgi:pimeloyl-ACP methyl ester carboxylesterase